jgi:hypothetical protein
MKQAGRTLIFSNYKDAGSQSVSLRLLIEARRRLSKEKCLSWTRYYHKVLAGLRSRESCYRRITLFMAVVLMKFG